MKNILKISVVTLTFATLFSGCIKETFPEGGTVTGDQVAASEAALKAMVNAMPVALMKANTAGYANAYNFQLDFGIPGIHLVTETMLNDVATMGDNPGYNHAYFYLTNQGQGVTGWPPGYFWECYYAWIKNANDVISLIDPEQATPVTIGYLGQAYAYRAKCYLDLARLFEPKPNKYTDVSSALGLTVPIVTEQTTEAEGTNNPRVSREVMYAFILEDLAKAEQYLANVNYNYTLPTQGFVYGLFARAYLEMGAAGDPGAYDKAAEYARKAITTSGCTPLTQEQWEDPITGFNNGAANKSWIMGLTVAAEQIGNLVQFSAHMCMEATWGYGTLVHLGADKRFYEQISDKDFRKHSWLDPKRDAFYKYKIAGNREEYLSTARDYETIKFRAAQGNTTDWAVGGSADHPLMRVEEMYFIEMEAKAHSDLSAAQNLLNSFMALRITDGSYDCKSKTPDLNAFLTEMLFQKRAEFWGEGVLIYDFKRLNVGINRGYKGTTHPGVARFNTEGRSPQWNIVIFRNEFLRNTGMGENNPDPTGTLVLWVDK